MSAKDYREEDFEDRVVGYLTAEARGSNRYQLRRSNDYDRSLCLVPDAVIDFVRSTQPEAYDRLHTHYGGDTDRKVCERLSREIAKWGVLHVLRKGFKDLGVTVRPVFFRPASALNPEHAALYRANRFSVIRQLHFSERDTKSLDLALFVNGIPVITAELKNSLTGQFVEQAIKQYKRDRDPREPLFGFLRCVAHFAVGNEEAYYTTRLAGDKTYFLPFNKGTESGGKGNPVNPSGHATAYVWEDAWQPDTLLDLLSDYLHVQTETEKVYDARKDAVVERTKKALIFPRYHQLDVVRKTVAAAQAEGPGHSYLVQHSAGSGKSNSIAWLAHQLRQLYRPGTRGEEERVFDTIVVVTDRRVLDQQLQSTIKQFEQTAGTVVPITETSAQLKEALEQGKDIVVTTLQKFPVISEAMDRIGGHGFAVIIDEAHSSQSGESAKHLKKTLAVNGGSEEETLAGAESEEGPGDAFDLEDEVVAEIQSRGRQDHISFFAFTATPKGKTLELFGRKGAGPDGSGTFLPFHTYTMRQAIEEGFILDVLRNYTTYQRYFRLVKAVEDDEEYERDKAVRALTSYVDLTDHAVEQKARVCLDHFLSVTQRAIQGRGRAMFVTRSRLHAVRYFLKFRQLMRELGLPFGPLVAFSGTVRDPATGAEHTEHSLNRLPPKTSIKEAFKLPAYRILVVANKFQTGFDEPMLHTMYVDKRLASVAAVQTLSRLNRTRSGKTDTVVIDFVNDAAEIKDAFQPYYQQTALAEETDPNKLYDLLTRLEQFEVHTPLDVEEYARAFFDDRVPGEALQPILDRVVGRWKARTEDEREDFRSLLQQFVRLYGYVSQLIGYADTDLEKAYVFARSLNRKLPKREGAGLPVEVTDAVDLDSFRLQQTYEGEVALEAEDGAIAGIPTEAGGPVAGPVMDYLSNIVTNLNNTFGIDLTDKDRVRVAEIVEDVTNDEEVRAVLAGDNSVSSKRHKVNEVIDGRILDQVHTSLDLYKKLTDPRVNETFKRQLFNQLLRSDR